VNAAIELDALVRTAGEGCWAAADPRRALVLLIDGLQAGRAIIAAHGSGRRLRLEGGRSAYHDPLVPAVTIDGEELTSLPLTPEVVRKADCVVVLCPHRTIDYDVIRTYARRIVDPTNTIAGRQRG
jgi:hypothetical protein